MDSNGREYTEVSDAGYSASSFELYDVLKGNEDAAKKAFREVANDEINENAAEYRDLTNSIKGWLPFAAEEYKISPVLSNYVAVPVMIMPSECPNRNGVGFPFKELTRFSVDTGTLMYKTWRGKPTHVEHQNQDPSRAKGVILHTAMRSMKPKYDRVWKVLALLAFDRSKDPILVNDILTKKRTAYSMGAYVRDYACSICDKRLKAGGCDHVDKQRPAFKMYGEDLAYYRALDPIGFETSSVATPAYITADNPDYFNMLKDKK